MQTPILVEASHSRGYSIPKTSRQASDPLISFMYSRRSVHTFGHKALLVNESLFLAVVPVSEAIK